MVYPFTLQQWYHEADRLMSDRPTNQDFEGHRLPMYYFAGHRATHWLEFLYCLCSAESAIYITATGPYRGFWVASCAQDLCGYFGEADPIQIYDITHV